MNGIECALTGRIGKQPELRTSKAGKPWCALNVAVDNTDNSDTEAAATQWVQVACFGETAERVAQLEKGARVYVEGALKLNTWTGRTAPSARASTSRRVSCSPWALSAAGVRQSRRWVAWMCRKPRVIGNVRCRWMQTVVPVDAIPF